ncbi:beta-class carbonic anhydrase [Pseudonocardia sp. CA-107938]|uniref:beta-class carbonic anhydrase n=1 Tax=Pseudonocardia sp. CA-107938 TaxID=3240021 RepID=UPI003D8F1745
MDADDLLDRSRRDGARASAAAAAGLAAAPARRAVIVTCMDARIDPALLFGLAPGEAHVLRNAGAVITSDTRRSIVISQRKLGTRTVLLVAHTGCGLASFTDDEFSTELELDTGLRPPWRPGTFADPAENVAAGLRALRRDPFLLPDTELRGFVLDVATFALTEVPEPT